MSTQSGDAAHKASRRLRAVGKDAHDELIVLFVELLIRLSPAPALLLAFGNPLGALCCPTLIILSIVVGNQELVRDVVLIALAFLLVRGVLQILRTASGNNSETRVTTLVGCPTMLRPSTA